VGAFHQPRLVLADTTRSPRCRRVRRYVSPKYGLLGDAAYFAWLEAERPAVFARDEPR